MHVVGLASKMTAEDRIRPLVVVSSRVLNSLVRYRGVEVCSSATACATRFDRRSEAILCLRALRVTHEPLQDPTRTKARKTPVCAQTSFDNL